MSIPGVSPCWRTSGSNRAGTVGTRSYWQSAASKRLSGSREASGNGARQRAPHDVNTHIHALCSPLIAVKSRRCATKDRANGCVQRRHLCKKKKKSPRVQLSLPVWIFTVKLTIICNGQQRHHMALRTVKSKQNKEQLTIKSKIEDQVLSKNVNNSHNNLFTDKFLVRNGKSWRFTSTCSICHCVR